MSASWLRWKLVMPTRQHGGDFAIDANNNIIYLSKKDSRYSSNEYDGIYKETNDDFQFVTPFGTIIQSFNNPKVVIHKS